MHAGKQANDLHARWHKAAQSISERILGGNPTAPALEELAEAGPNQHQSGLDEGSGSHFHAGTDAFEVVIYALRNEVLQFPDPLL